MSAVDKRLLLASVVALVAVAATAHAEAVAVETIVRRKVGESLPADLGVTKVFLPPGLASYATDPGHVVVEVPRELRAGRPTVKVAVRGRSAVFVPVAIGKLVEVAVATRTLPVGHVIEASDVALERRAVETAGGAAVKSIVGSVVTIAVAANQPIASKAIALPPPLSRGTRVTLEMRRGSVRVRGSATLESAARPGEVATVRLAHTRTMVRGTLHAPSTVVVEETP
jgi:flagella basal body P-ring formation protein FlgA